MMSEDRVFTNPDAPTAYKPGDKGDAVMVVVVGMPGKKFRALIYDRDKLEHLGPGPHSTSDYGQVQDQVEAFGLTFNDTAASHAFVTALRECSDPGKDAGHGALIYRRRLLRVIDGTRDTVNDRSPLPKWSS